MQKLKKRTKLIPLEETAIAAEYDTSRMLQLTYPDKSVYLALRKAEFAEKAGGGLITRKEKDIIFDNQHAPVFSKIVKDRDFDHSKGKNC